MRTSLFVFFIILLMQACSTTPKTEEKLTRQNNINFECYGSYTDKDSVFLKLEFDGDTVTGDLTYKLFEKDKNNGVIQGSIHGDTIFAIYKFVSEGQPSIREVAFLRQGSALVEGFAPMNEAGTHFNNKSELDFTGIVLQPDRCR